MRKRFGDHSLLYCLEGEATSSMGEDLEHCPTRQHHPTSRANMRGAIATATQPSTPHPTTLQMRNTGATTSHPTEIGNSSSSSSAGGSPVNDEFMHRSYGQHLFGLFYGNW